MSLDTIFAPLARVLSATRGAGLILDITAGVEANSSVAIRVAMQRDDRTSCTRRLICLENISKYGFGAIMNSWVIADSLCGR